ncbi:hypothetical protein CLV46_2841 [Diaminobutyricimonas aerilata]|uniref:Uncharacterized protein n=1 Tax=Diaminobutyricimonas aerilata TaxID=1162967 RepID=A0A2M9CMZ1_9MICO|nr:hypothetical protein [Diaminobutyricimonas aerilata]PJJ73255.1 hypothetical protein CLV46_2841 [Diaminobutyricimonas aerilata]
MTDASKWDALSNAVLADATVNEAPLSPAVEQTVKEIRRGAYSRAEILLRLERASAPADLRTRLDELVTSHQAELAAVPMPDGNDQTAAWKRASPAVRAHAVGSTTLAVLSPIPVLPAFRRAGEYILPVETGAVISGVLALIAASLLLWGETRRDRTFGSRTGLLSGAAVVATPIAVAIALAVAAARAGGEPFGVTGPAIGGLVLLAAALATAVAYAVLAGRHRRAVPSQRTVDPNRARVDALKRHDEIDRGMLRRLRDVVADHADRDAAVPTAVAGVRWLYLDGEVDDATARWLLQRLAGGPAPRGGRPE